jgi:hypothetical protein
MEGDRMTLEARGFLSNHVERQKSALRQIHQERFDLVDQVSDLAQRLMPTVATVSRSKKNLLACAFFVRGLQALQGGIIMAERGMVTEARILARTVLETLFYLAANLKQEEFGHRLDRDHVARFEKIANAHTRLSPSTEPSQEVKELNKALDAIRNTAGDGQSLAVYEVARQAGMTVTYESYYRGLSTDSAHPTVLSLSSIWQIDPDGRPTGVLWGPEVRDVSDTLEILALFGILLLDQVNLLIGDKDAERTSLDLSRKYLQLRGIEPSSTVTS